MFIPKHDSNIKVLINLKKYTIQSPCFFFTKNLAVILLVSHLNQLQLLLIIDYTYAHMLVPVFAIIIIM